MPPSRKIVFAFGGVFLVGIAVGALLFNTFQDMRFTRFLNSTSDPKSMAARINLKYVKEDQLTPDEQAHIAPITQEMTLHLYQVRRQFGIDIISTLDDYHGRIAAQMTPEHRQLFAQANTERKKRMAALLLLDSPPAETK